jgi:hypothetical protein
VPTGDGTCRVWYCQRMMGRKSDQGVFLLSLLAWSIGNAVAIWRDVLSSGLMQKFCQTG